MYLASYEVDRISRPSRNDRKAQHRAEFDIINRRAQSRIDRLRVMVSNALIAIANAVRPTDATRGEIASAR